MGAFPAPANLNGRCGDGKPASYIGASHAGCGPNLSEACARFVERRSRRGSCRFHRLDPPGDRDCLHAPARGNTISLRIGMQRASPALRSGQKEPSR